MSKYENATSSSYVENVRRDNLTESTGLCDIDYNISQSGIPSFREILVPDDGKEISNKALSHAIYPSNLSGADSIVVIVN